MKKLNEKLSSSHTEIILTQLLTHIQFTHPDMHDIIIENALARVRWVAPKLEDEHGLAKEMETNTKSKTGRRRNARKA